MSGFRHTETPALYPVAGATTDAEIAAKLALIQRADVAARAYDPRITQVRAGFNDELRRILVAASDGTFASDTQPLARLNVFVIAKDAAATTASSTAGAAAAAAAASPWTSSPAPNPPSTSPTKPPAQPSSSSTP